MKKLVLFIFTAILLIGCQEQENLSPEQLINNFFEGFDQSDYNAISSCVSDSILIKEGDFVLANSKENLKTTFQWDSVFKPSYSVDSIAEVDGRYECTITKNDKRIAYLHKLPTTYKVLVTISGNKITNIESGDYIVFDFEKWQANREALVAWVNINYPEYTNFMSVPGLKGAQKILMLIELYEASLLEVE